MVEGNPPNHTLDEAVDGRASEGPCPKSTPSNSGFQGLYDFFMSSISPVTYDSQPNASQALTRIHFSEEDPCFKYKQGVRSLPQSDYRRWFILILRNAPQCHRTPMDCS